MNKVLAIGLNTFKESIRDKIFYSLLFFAVILILFSIQFNPGLSLAKISQGPGAPGVKFSGAKFNFGGPNSILGANHGQKIILGHIREVESSTDGVIKV